MSYAALLEIPALLGGAGLLATTREPSRVWLALSLPAAVGATLLSAPALCASPSALLAFVLTLPLLTRPPPQPASGLRGVPFGLAGRAAVALAAAARARK